MWRHIASNALTFLILGLFLLSGLLLWGRGAYVTQGPLDQAICLNVPRGATMHLVSERLEEQGAIRAGWMFRAGADYTGKAQALKAGSYLVPEGASMARITDIVTRGGASTCGTEIVYRIGITQASAQLRELDPQSGRYEIRASFTLGEGTPPASYEQIKQAAGTRFRVALAEGVTSWQVLKELGQIDILTGETALPPEGSLAPDSYEIRPGETIGALVARMQSAQSAILETAWAGRTSDLPLSSAEEALILASIVEKETGNAQERFDVASVFVNRLNKGMRLQTDPTVIYGITRGQGVLGRGLRRSELDRETPWNTYVIKGLPPTPIANPGRAAIEAVLNPSQTDHIYFVAKTLDPADGHNFASTLDAHNRNVAAYRALEAARE